MRICKYCGKELVRKRRGSGKREASCHFKKRVYCGPICSRRGVALRNKGVETPKAIAARVTQQLTQAALCAKVMGKHG